MTPLDIKITNKEILAYLDSLKDMFFDYKEKYGLYLDPKFNPKQYSSERAKEEPLFFLSKDYLNKMKNKKLEHKGFPEEYMAIPSSILVKSNSEWKPFIDEVKDGLVHYVGASKSSLANYYPPKGFVGWHTNWNNPGYQLLFTWSKTGDSFFLYEDCDSKQVNMISERPGWQGHLVYFGRQEEKEHVFWHSAYSNCDRFAWGPTWKVTNGINSEQSKQSKEIIRMLIDELQEN